MFIEDLELQRPEKELTLEEKVGPIDAFISSSEDQDGDDTLDEA